MKAEVLIKRPISELPKDNGRYLATTNTGTTIRLEFIQGEWYSPNKTLIVDYWYEPLEGEVNVLTDEELKIKQRALAEFVIKECSENVIGSMNRESILKTDFEQFIK